MVLGPWAVAIATLHSAATGRNPYPHGELAELGKQAVVEARSVLAGLAMVAANALPDRRR